MSEKKYIPKGKDILTRHGCICKNKYVDSDDRTHIDTCTTDDGDAVWCAVKGKCGMPNLTGKLKGQWWDNCDLAPRSVFDSSIKYGKKYFGYNMIGIIIYIIIFVITIPIILYRSGYHAFLEVYMPNFDLLATAISYGAGPGKYNIFQELYNSKSDNLLGYSSTLFINYLSLLGLTYLVARRVKLTKSLAKGWGIGFVMLLLTYLVPNEFISAAQHRFAKKLTDVFGIQPSRSRPPYISYFSVVGLGLLIAGGFILVEKVLVSNHKLWLDPLVKHILLIDDFLDKKA